MTDRTQAPAINEFPRLSLPQPLIETLDNGVTMLRLSGGTQPVAQLNMYWLGGAFEAANPALPGMAIRMLREGSNNHSADDIEYALDYNGAYLREQNLTHYTGLSLMTVSDKLPDLLPLMMDITTNPAVNPERLEMRRAEAIANRQMVERRVAVQADEQLNRLLKGINNPGARIANVESIKSLTVDEIAGFQRRLLRPSAMIVAVSGMVDDEVYRRVTERIADLKEPSSPAFERLCVPFAPEPVQVSRIKVDGAVQSAIAMGMPTIDRSHDDYCRLRLTVFALGGYFGSRLMANIREQRGLTYGISASMLGFAEGGQIQIATETDNAYVEEVIEQTRYEIEQLVLNPPCGAELERLKQNYMTTQAAILESPFRIMSTFMPRIMSNMPADYFDRQMDAIAEVTPEMISEMAAKYINPADLRIIAVR